MTLERAKQIIQENFGDKYDVEFSLSPANIQQQVQPDSASEPVIPIPVTGKMVFRFGTPTPRRVT